MRPAEGAAALTCKLVFDHDYNAGLRQYKGCATLRCLMRKNDQERKGHQMRFWVSTDPELDLLFQLGLFMDAAGTRPRTNCNGRLNKRCTVCPPLFPKLTRGPNHPWVVAADPTPTPALVSSMVSAVSCVALPAVLLLRLFLGEFGLVFLVVGKLEREGISLLSLCTWIGLSTPSYTKFHCLTEK
jgi:hypothetical protein